MPGHISPSSSGSVWRSVLAGNFQRALNHVMQKPVHIGIAVREMHQRHHMRVAHDNPGGILGVYIRSYCSGCFALPDHITDAPDHPFLEIEIFRPCLVPDRSAPFQPHADDFGMGAGGVGKGAHQIIQGLRGCLSRPSGLRHHIGQKLVNMAQNFVDQIFPAGEVVKGGRHRDAGLARHFGMAAASNTQPRKHHQTAFKQLRSPVIRVHTSAYSAWVHKK